MAKKESLRKRKAIPKRSGKLHPRRNKKAAEDTTTVEILQETEERIDIGMSSIIGTRSIQEDSVFAYGCGNEAIAVVCDGMGGLAGGELASQTAVKSLTDAWFERKEEEDFPEFLKEEAIKADEKVFLLENEKGERIEAGSTIVAAIVRGSHLYWLSVGDSKIYIIRGEEMISACRMHNYRLTLDQKLEQGTITPEEYRAEEYRAEALISYLGMGNVSLMDVNRQPFFMEDGDIVLLSSDGLYKSLAEDEILDVVRQNKGDMQRLADALTEHTLDKKKSGQDNTSVAVLRYCPRKLNTPLQSTEYERNEEETE